MNRINNCEMHRVAGLLAQGETIKSFEYDESVIGTFIPCEQCHDRDVGTFDSVYILDKHTAITPPMLELITALREKLRGIQFTIGSTNFRATARLVQPIQCEPHGQLERDTIEAISVYSELYAYFPEQEFSLGRIGYGDVRINKSNGKFTGKYFIKSPHITNDKYDQHRDQYNMEASTNLTTLLRKGVKALRPVTAKQLAIASASECASLTHEARHVPWRAFNDAKIRVFNDNKTEQMATFILKLADEGAYVPAELQEALEAYRTCKDVYDKQRTTKLPGVFVSVSQVGVVKVFDVQGGIPNILSDSLSHDIRTIALQPERFTQDTLPEHIAGKLMMLSMLQENSYVEGVGIRLSDTRFVLQCNTYEA